MAQRIINTLSPSVATTSSSVMASPTMTDVDAATNLRQRSLLAWLAGVDRLAAVRLYEQYVCLRCRPLVRVCQPLTRPCADSTAVSARFCAIDPEQTTLLVTDMATKLFTYPAAKLRSDDVLYCAFETTNQA